MITENNMLCATLAAWCGSSDVLDGLQQPAVAEYNTHRPSRKNIIDERMN